MGQQYAGQVAQEMGVYPDSGVQALCEPPGPGARAPAPSGPGCPGPSPSWTIRRSTPLRCPAAHLHHPRHPDAHELRGGAGHGAGPRDRPRHRAAFGAADDPAAAGPDRHGGRARSPPSKIAQNLGRSARGSACCSSSTAGMTRSQADGLGFRYALNDGYDVRRMVDMFAILQRVSARAGQRIPEVAVHPPRSRQPDPGDRAGASRGSTVPLDDKKVNREQFLRIIDGMVYGDNPAAGLLQGAPVPPPGPRLPARVSPGWKTANQPSAVMGVSPKQDAQVQLSLGRASRAGRSAQDSFWGSRASRRAGPPDDDQRQPRGPRRPSPPRTEEGASSPDWWPSSPTAGSPTSCWASPRPPDGHLRPDLPAVRRQLPPADRSGGARV